MPFYNPSQRPSPSAPVEPVKPGRYWFRIASIQKRQKKDDPGYYAMFVLHLFDDDPDYSDETIGTVFLFLSLFSDNDYAKERALDDLFNLGQAIQNMQVADSWEQVVQQFSQGQGICDVEIEEDQRRPGKYRNVVASFVTDPQALRDMGATEVHTKTRPAPPPTVDKNVQDDYTYDDDLPF